MFCPQCGNKTDDNARFCICCGHSFETVRETPAEKTKKYCTHCGNEIDKNAVVCPHCGEILRPEVFNPPAPAPQQETSNVLAILGLIFSFLMPVVGLVCSIIGLNQAKKMNGNGHSLALAGVIVSAVLLALWLILFMIFLIPVSCGLAMPYLYGCSYM